MAQQIINIGTTANDGTGDPLRTAFDKCNDNFTELYAGGGGGGGGIGGNTGSTDNAILRADGTGGSTLQTSGITIADGASGTLSGTNSGDQNIFSTVSAGGQSLIADSTSDTLTLVAGTNVSITADASTDTITISATGGSGGGNVSGPASPTTDNALVRWDGTTGQLIQNSSVTLSDTQEMSGLKSLTFNTAGGTVGLAKMVWDTTNQTIDLGIGSGSVNALLGVDSHVLGRNTTGSTINRGEVVRVNGASSGNLTIALAQGNTDPNTANTIGIAAETIANNATGMVITSGLLRDINTSTFTAGDLLYISATTAGLLVNTIPTAPNHAVRMGYVVSSHPSNGIIYVAVNNGYELNELHDVNYPTTPATNDFLVYVTNRWENQVPATARTSMGLGALATVTPASGVATFLTTPSSANLAAAITDETGTGSLVFATSPTLVTPTLGVASATSINKVSITAPATGSTLTIADGKTLTASNTLTFTGTDSSSVAFGGGGTVAYTGGKLSQFAATSSSELAGVISDETGTGALVFANTPTLVTPVLGTPTSGTLTNCTGLPLSTGVTGTLPIANGGTGQTTAVDAFDALAPTTTKGDLILHNGTDNVRLAVGGTNGHVLTVDSTTATGVKWAAAGGGGGGGGSTNVWIPAAQWIPRTTSGCGIDSREQATGNINTDELLFDQAAIEFAQAMVVMPSNYDNGTVTARFYWTASAGTASQSVVWAIRGRAFGDNVALGQTYASGGTGILDTYLAANQMHVSDPTAAVTIAGTPAANKAVIFEAFRDASNVNDTLAADARFLGVEIAYTSA